MENKNSRLTWDAYFMEIAQVTAKRSTCPRLSVGAVLVKDDHTLATGYNGSLSGTPHCIDRGCYLEYDHCILAVHAEANIIIQAARNKISTEGTTIYVTANPCLSCFKLLYQAGIKRIVFKNQYKEVDYSILGVTTKNMPEMVVFNNISNDSSMMSTINCYGAN